MGLEGRTHIHVLTDRENNCWKAYDPKKAESFQLSMIRWVRDVAYESGCTDWQIWDHNETLVAEGEV